MLHFEIMINDRAIKRIEAVNTGSKIENKTIYDVKIIDYEDETVTEKKILHDRHAGAEELARKILT